MCFSWRGVIVNVSRLLNVSRFAMLSLGMLGVTVVLFRNTMTGNRITVVPIDERFVWISNAGQVLGTRTVVEVFQHRVSPWAGVGFGDVRLWVVEIAELDRLGWTSVLASGRDFVGSDFPVFNLGENLLVGDSLGTVSTLLHHASTADGDFWIHHQVLQLTVTGRKLVRARVFEQRNGVTVIQVIEATHLVRTVVAAISSSDTAVVNHVVEAFVAVNRRGNRTNRFAWSILTVMAGDGLLLSLIHI